MVKKMLKNVDNISFKSDFNYARLTDKDIKKLPYNAIKSLPANDVYESSSKKIENNNTEKKQNRAKKIALGVVIAGVALFIGKKLNLFNPVKRELNKIVNEPLFKKRAVDFVNKNANEENYKLITKGLLNDLAENNVAEKAERNVAKEILNDKKSFDSLYERVSKKLNNDSPVGLKNGFVVELMDRLSVNLEGILKGAKKEGHIIKDEHVNMVGKLFEKPQEGKSLAEIRFNEIIESRIYKTFKECISEKL